MLKSNLCYPYPMLRSEPIDYRTSIINSKIDIETNEKSYKLKIEISTNNKDINNLLEKGHIKKGILVKSNTVWFRKFYYLSNNSEIVIDSKDVYGRVELLPCIVATQRIENFFSDDFEDEYKYSNINIECGEFIALGDEYCFDALLESDIFKNTSSIFEMIPTDENNVSYDINGHKIVIYIPKNMHQNYLNVANSIASPKSILNSIIVFPVLVSVLFDIMTASEDEYLERKWYITIMKTIESKKKNNGIVQGLDNVGNIENPLLVAQSLTNGLTLSSFIKLKNILENEGNEWYENKNFRRRGT